MARLTRGRIFLTPIALRGRLAILGDADSMLSSVKKYLGYSLNDTDPDLIKRCGEVLKKQKPHITEVADDNGQDLLAAGRSRCCSRVERRYRPGSSLKTMISAM